MKINWKELKINQQSNPPVQSRVGGIHDARRFKIFDVSPEDISSNLSVRIARCLGIEVNHLHMSAGISMYYLCYFSGTLLVCLLIRQLSTRESAIGVSASDEPLQTTFSILNFRARAVDLQFRREIQLFNIKEFESELFVPISRRKGIHSSRCSNTIVSDV